MSVKQAMHSCFALIFQILWRGPLSPFISGSVLFGLIAAPAECYAALDQLPFLPNHAVEIAKTALKLLFSLGIGRVLNLAFGTMAANSWRMRAAQGWDWPNEVAVVTGGCAGIGYSIVERLVRHQVKVAILDIQDLPESFQAHPYIRYYNCDITSPESVLNAADTIRQELGHPTILVNNAGISQPTTILQTSQTFLQRIFSVNCMSHWATVQQFLPHMISTNKGHVVTIASVASFITLGKDANYAATKAAALSFHETLSLELKHYYKADNVLTTVVHPAFVRTSLIQSYEDQLEGQGFRLLTTDYVADKIMSQVLSRRGGQLIVPSSQSIMAGLRGWPTWLQVIFRDAYGRAVSRMWTGLDMDKRT